MSAATRQRQVRVFISSTFRDMNSERDHLVTVVFPELRERIESLGLEFFDVDLRWGVPQSGIDGERANSWAYCKRWIDEVEPFFVCVLGQRYGWRPPGEEITDPSDRAAYEGLSITEMEIRHALKHPPHLKHTMFYLRRTEVPRDAGRYSEFVDDGELQDSLLGLKGLIEGQDRPVREYECEWTGDGFRDLEAFGAAVLEDLWGATLRDERYVSREVWQQVLGHDPTQDPLYSDPSRIIPRELWERLVEAARPAPQDPLDVEAQQMARYADARLRWFQGRTKELAELRLFVDEDGPEGSSRLRVVRAAPGAGKTALLAKLASELDDSGHLVISHFVGSTPSSTDPRSMLERLVSELHRGGVPAPGFGEVGRDHDTLSKQFAAQVQDYAGPRRIVLLLDALNELTEGHSLSWLPFRLGAGVRVVVSCVQTPCAAPDDAAMEVEAALTAHGLEPTWLDLSPLAEGDVRSVVAEYLQEYCKQLDEPQVRSIAGMPQAANPLYLRAMLDVLRTLGGNDMHLRVADIIARLPQQYPDAQSLFVWVLERLEDGFGRESVALWCSYLALGRSGMSSEELRDLLARGAEEQPARRDEARKLALRIERGLRRYLLRRGAQFDFLHGELRRAVRERYLDDESAQARLRVAMADYFEGHSESARRDDELPWQLAKAQRWGRLRGLLTDLRALKRLLDAGRKYEVLAFWHAMSHEYSMADEYQRVCHEYAGTMGHDGVRADGLAAAGELLWTAAEHHGAGELFMLALDAEVASSGEQAPAVAERQLSLSTVLLAASNVSEAESLARAALHVQQSAFGPEDPRTTKALNQLANCLLRPVPTARLHARVLEAYELLCQALAIDEASRGPNHPDMARDANNMASVLAAMGRPHEVERSLREALRIVEAYWGRHHVNIAVSLNNLGVRLKRMWKHSDAEALLRRALEIDERVFGPDHPDTGRDLGNLGMVLQQDGRPLEAEPMLRRVLQIDEAALGPDHPDVAVDHHNLACLLADTERRDEAESHWLRAIAIVEAARGEADPTALRARTALEKSRAQQRGTEQERRAAAIESEQLLGRSLMMQGEPWSAMASFRKAESLCAAAGDWVAVQNNIGFQSEALCAMGNFEEALATDRRREQICREHAVVEGLVISLANQAQLQAEQFGQPEVGLSLATEALQIARENAMAGLASAIARIVASIKDG